MKVIWSERADEELGNNLEYVEKNWGINSAAKFLEEVYQKIKKIKANPGQFEIHDSTRNIRKCHVRKQITIYYQFEGELINLLSVFNNAQSPQRLVF